ncbi:PREDICTED: enhancer of rudimentary homolog isoform X4 [Theobroma cacao]|uniref:Enhancer of rudimentary homolog isoform X4 n=1 Tax=Theobroma cacao TaxID=3641 RepID=A0AB32X3H7_THECC|nr:PREDICTED: enhancer of rudimentary homolog isoform X4 [Theobroma cacao]
MQTSQNRAPRTFVDYDSISQAMDGIRGLYERKLKKLNPATQNITYDIGVLYNFIDGLADMIALASSLQITFSNQTWLTISLMLVYRMEINGSAGVSENAVDRIVVKSF